MKYAWVLACVVTVASTGCMPGYIKSKDLEAKGQGPTSCAKACEDIGMRMTAMVLVGDTVPGCVCQVLATGAPAASPAPSPAVSPASGDSPPAAPSDVPPAAPSNPGSGAAPASGLPVAPAGSVAEGAAASSGGYVLIAAAAAARQQQLDQQRRQQQQQQK